MDATVKKVNKLISGIAEGESRALDKLYDLTSRMLLAMARKYLIEKNYAEDLVSETYLKIVKNAHKFDSNKNGLNWIFKIIHNAAIDYNKKTNPYSSFDEQIGEETDYDIDDWLDSIIIKDALNKLTQEEKRVIYLRYWEGYGIAEIAEKINKPLTTAHDYIKRTLKKIKEMLK